RGRRPSPGPRRSWDHCQLEHEQSKRTIRSVLQSVQPVRWIANEIPLAYAELLPVAPHRPLSLQDQVELLLVGPVTVLTNRCAGGYNGVIDEVAGTGDLTTLDDPSEADLTLPVVGASLFKGEVLQVASIEG